MVNYFKNLFLVLLAIFVISCNSAKKTTIPRNLSQIYNSSSSSIHPNLKVYNDSDTSSVLVMQIFTKELLYNQANPNKELQAEVKIIYNLYDLNNKQNLVDSSSVTYKLKKDKAKTNHIYNIPIKSRIGNKYFLEVICSDEKRNSTHYAFLRINRDKALNEQDFLVYNSEKNLLKLTSYVDSVIPFSIKHYKKEFDSLYVYHYSNSFKSSKSPDLLDTLKNDFETVDTSWVCYLDSINFSNFQNEGVYFFATNKVMHDDLKNTEGVALYNFGDDYPIVKTPEDLIKPLIYIDNVDIDSDSDSTGKYTKLAVDNFWLSKAKNMDKSRELLKIFYNRVMYANKYFTSYKEGWQTDRGMIFIIYGLPDYLFKSGLEEEWIYNAHGMGVGIVFTFNYTEDNFSINQFGLDREKLKFTGWEDAIEMWKKGEVFYFQK